MSASPPGKQPVPDTSPTMKRVLSALASRTPLSAAELAHEAAVSLSTLINGGYLRKLKATGHIFIAGWGKNPNGFTMALYSLGNQPDCPRPKFQDADRDSIGLARIVRALQLRSGQAAPELAKSADLSLNTVRGRRYMEILLKQQRAHICEWRRSRSGGPCPLYAAGPGKNATKPTPMSKAEIRQRYRFRLAIREGHLPTLGKQLNQVAKLASEKSSC